MANDPFEKQIDSGTTFKSDLLSGVDRTEWPDRIDYVASRITDGEYVVGPQTTSPEYLIDGYDLERTARDFYLKGIAALTGDSSRTTALPDSFQLGNLLVEFAGLRDGLEDVDRRDVPPGEILSRLITRTVQRQTSGKEAQIARQLRADAETPRELVADLTTTPEVAPIVQSALPDPEDPATLTTELASLDLTTELWNHQLESLALWLYHGTNAYVDMATATGKTVLGLAAVAHAVDSGSLHPADQERLGEIFDADLPDPHRNRPNNVLIVTTDDLLGVQWARLFQEHCHTPPAFTNVEDTGIRLPWGRIDIRSASGLTDVDPSDYRLAIFDEVHNYSAKSGWGNHLVEFVESACPVLALTGSVTDELESLVTRTDRTFPLVYRYTHDLALSDGVIPDFEWTLAFTDVTDSDALTQFRETAEQFARTIEYDGGTYRLDDDALADAAPDLSESEVAQIAGDYVSGSALAKGLRETGDDGTAPTESLESLANGVGNRTIHRLNLSADLEPIAELARSALTEKRPVLVLTRSYGEAREIEQELDDRSGERVVKRLEAGQSAAEHDETIRSFDAAGTDEKVLIGPGKRIGQGNDIQSVEVGINIARPGSGVNATLVQRLGRLLRDAGGKDIVEFYHVIGVPPADATIEPDGESFVRTVSEFFGQVLEPDTDGILKPPSVSIEDGVASAVAALEQRGSPTVRADEQSTIIELAYSAAIDERNENDGPTVATDWFSAAFGNRAQPAIGEESAEGGASTDHAEIGTEVDTYTRSGRNLSDEAGGTRNVDGSIDDRDDAGGSDGNSRTDAEPIEGASPLAEYADAFRSLAIVHEALRESAKSDFPDSDPLRRWTEDVRSIVAGAGYGDQRASYGEQVARSPVSIAEYREHRGTGTRVTEFESVSVHPLSEAITALLSESLADLSSWVVPVAPESEVPVPVVVESDAELDRARALLDEFPAEPPVFADESADQESDADQRPAEGGASTDRAEDTERHGESESRLSERRDSPPVEDVRGVSDSIAAVLRDADYERLVDLQTASDEELTAVEGVSEQRVQLIRAAVGRK